MAASEAFSATIFLTNPKNLYPNDYSNQGFGNQGTPFQKGAVRDSGGKGANNNFGKGSKGSGKDVKGKFGKKGSSDIFKGGGSTGQQRYGSKVKTSKADDKGKPLCKPWNDNRNGVGCTMGAGCNNRHACDIMMPNGKVCLMPHPRTQHTGPTVALE
jgi:hypothetical protein